MGARMHHKPPASYFCRHRCLSPIEEHKICELQEMARSMIIHVVKRWSKMVTAHLWPYTIRMAARALNETPSFPDEEDAHVSKYSPKHESAQIQNIGNHLAVQCMCLNHSCKKGQGSTTSGQADPKRDCTWVNHPTTTGVLHWYWMSIPHILLYLLSTHILFVNECGSGFV